MKKKTDKTSPATPASEQRDQVTTIDSTSVGIEVVHQTFEGTEILMAKYEGRIIVPVRRLAEMFDIPYGKAMEKITAKSALFEGEIVSLKKEDYLSLYPVTGYSDDMRSFDCFSIAGALQWITILSYGRYDPERRDYIVRVRRWLAKTGEGVILAGRPNDMVEIGTPLSDALKEEMKRAEAMTIVGVDISKSTSACLAKLEDQYGEPLDYLRMLVPRNTSEDLPVLTATAIGKELNRTPQAINDLLERLGYLTHDYRVKKTGTKQKVWNLTDAGRAYGEIVLERHGGADVSYILWRRSIVDILRVHIEAEQATLPGCSA